MKINYITAQFARAGDVLIVDGREFVVSEMEFLNDDTNVSLRGFAQGIGNIRIIVPDNETIEIVKEG
jgi:regulatory protein YycH of two-component signal transduction system YycFG